MTSLLNHLSVIDAAKKIAAGDITSEALVSACLRRIAARDAAVKAWAVLDPDHALAQARERDREAPRGPLHGIPVGVKDVIDTADMATEMGSVVYKGWRPKADAAVVAQLRAAGAVILGKTVTAEFAGTAPGPTANPLNPAHTPGGSSSGSGAAVADFQVAIAIGTQTGGSVLRPASFCGIFGYKPTYGTIARGGLKFAAESLDTIGLLARSLDDMALATDVLVNRPATVGAVLARAPRIGVCRTMIWDKAQPETVAAVEDAAARLAKAGAQVADVAMPGEFEALGKIRDDYNHYERARALAYEWQHFRDRLSPQMHKTIAAGLATPFSDYVETVRTAARLRERAEALFDGVDVLLAPAVNGEAPEGLHYTGDPSFQQIWTILHVPTLTLPTHKGPKGLPVGIQLVAPRFRDELLFQAARWAWEKLGPAM